MSRKDIIKKLVKKAGSDKALVQSDLTEYFKLNSPEYYDLEKELASLEIDVLLVDDELEEDEELFDDEDMGLNDDEDEPDEFSLSCREVEEVEEEELLNVETIPSTIKVDDSVRMYIKEIGQIPLLKIDEERKYAIMIHEGRVVLEQLESYRNVKIDLSDVYI